MDLYDAELNRVLGGGLVPGSLVLLGGEPGIGKSTLVLQTVLGLRDKRVLYVSGEESARQIKLRAERRHPRAPWRTEQMTCWSLPRPRWSRYTCRYRRCSPTWW